MPGAFAEQDVCGLVLSVDIRMDQMLLAERPIERLFLAEEYRSLGSGRAAPGPVPPRSTTGAPGKVQRGVFEPLAALEADHACVDAVDLCPAGFHTQAMPELLRLGEYFGR